MVLKRCGLCRADTMHYRGACMACPISVVEVRTPEDIMNVIRENDGQITFDLDEDEKHPDDPDIEC